jgi:hypothetical protein
MEARKGYFLKLYRRGKERPEESAGKLQIKGKNIDNYTIWENGRKYSAVDMDTLLKLFEISEIDKPCILFHLFSDRDEEHRYEQIERLDDFKTRRLTATYGMQGIDPIIDIVGSTIREDAKTHGLDTVKRIRENLK